MPNPPQNYGLNTVTNLWSEDQQEAIYDAYLLAPAYYFHAGVAQMPVQGPDGTACEIVKTSAACVRVAVACAAAWVSRRRCPIPGTRRPRKRNAGGVQWTLLDSVIVPASPRLEADGLTYIWTAVGVYLYALNIPASLNGPLPTGAMPYSKQPGGANFGVRGGQFPQCHLRPVRVWDGAAGAWESIRARSSTRPSSLSEATIAVVGTYGVINSGWPAPIVRQQLLARGGRRCPFRSCKNGCRCARERCLGKHHDFADAHLDVRARGRATGNNRGYQAQAVPWTIYLCPCCSRPTFFDGEKHIPGAAFRTWSITCRTVEPVRYPGGPQLYGRRRLHGRCPDVPEDSSCTSQSTKRRLAQPELFLPTSITSHLGQAAAELQEVGRPHIRTA